MQRYDTLLFDADGTLLDFIKAEYNALKKVFATQKLAFNEAVYHTYHRINDDLWKQFERGEITKPQLLATRFGKLIDTLQLKANPAPFQSLYQEALGEGGYVIPGAQEALKALSADCRLFLITNGVSKTQHSRMTRSGLREYFKDVFVSEDAGFQKPLREYFDYVAKHIENYTPKTTLVIGDSLSSDILGGQNAGLDTCWYNPQHQKNTTSIVPTFEISSLSMLAPIVLGKE